MIEGGFGLRNEQLAETATALVKASPDAIVTAGPIASRAAQVATKTIPILAASDNMVEDGLVPSVRRPGSNTTGVSLLAVDLDGKRQELEAVPGIRRIATLADPKYRHAATPAGAEERGTSAWRGPFNFFSLLHQKRSHQP